MALRDLCTVFVQSFATQAGGRNPLLAALCFDCQVVHEVPCEDHDVRMDAVVTPKIILGKRGG